MSRKSSEPSLRDKLSESFMKAFEADFEKNGLAAIEKMRESNPSKYAEIAAKLIAPAEPTGINYEDAKTGEELARMELEGLGADPDTITQDILARALAALDRYGDALAELVGECGATGGGFEHSGRAPRASGRAPRLSRVT